MDENCRKAREVYSLAEIKGQPVDQQELRDSLTHFENCEDCQRALREVNSLIEEIRSNLEQMGFKTNRPMTN